MWLAADIGGTKTIAAAVDTDGQVLSHRFVPTPTTSTDDLIEAVAAQWRAVGVQVGLLTTEPGQLTELSRRCATPPTNAAQIIGTSSYYSWLERTPDDK